ncbi:MAG: pentapeptide repeat-containing protein [Pseudomonadales bacterium]
MTKPHISDDPLYQLLRLEKVEEFNQQRDKLDPSKLKGGDYRGLDLRTINAEGLDFSDSYFRNADLRGLDLRKTHLEGANLRDANISGVYFPKPVTAAEIRLSIEFGTRIRYRNA